MGELLKNKSWVIMSKDRKRIAGNRRITAVTELRAGERLLSYKSLKSAETGLKDYSFAYPGEKDNLEVVQAYISITEIL